MPLVLMPSSSSFKRKEKTKFVQLMDAYLTLRATKIDGYEAAFDNARKSFWVETLNILFLLGKREPDKAKA